MSNTNVQTLPAVSDGAVMSLPKNFDKLPERRQKALIVAIIQEQQMEIADAITQYKKMEVIVKAITSRIRMSKEYRELNELKKQIKKLKDAEDAMIDMRSGMLKLSKKMGFDVHQEVSRIKQLEA